MLRNVQVPLPGGGFASGAVASPTRGAPLNRTNQHHHDANAADADDDILIDSNDNSRCDHDVAENHQNNHREARNNSRPHLDLRASLANFSLSVSTSRCRNSHHHHHHRHHQHVAAARAAASAQEAEDDDHVICFDENEDHFSPHSHQSPSPSSSSSSSNINAKNNTNFIVPPLELPVSPKRYQREQQHQQQEEQQQQQQQQYNFENPNETNTAAFFSIPTLPSGRILIVRILSSWGNARCVGLAGIELFDDGGNCISIPPSSVVAITHHQEAGEGTGVTTARRVVSSSSSSSSSTNTQNNNNQNNNNQQANSQNQKADEASCLFPLSNLVTEPFDTTDALSMWVQMLNISNQQQNNNNNINNINQLQNQQNGIGGFAIVLPRNSNAQITTRISAVRIWNYNGNGRCHVDRGARHVELFLDEQRIFCGEVRCAAGDARNADGVETILMTDSMTVLQKIAEHAERQARRWDEDEVAAAAAGGGGDAGANASSLSSFSFSQQQNHEHNHQQQENQKQRPSSTRGLTERPLNRQGNNSSTTNRSFCVAKSQTLTSAVLNQSNNNNNNHNNNQFHHNEDQHQYFQQQSQSQSQNQSQTAFHPHNNSIAVQNSIEIIIADAWEGGRTVGLSSLQFLDENGNEIPQNNLQVSCREGFDSSSSSSSSYLVPQLIDNDPETFWLHQIEDSFPLILTVSFLQQQQEEQKKISAIRFANFAGSKQQQHQQQQQTQNENDQVNYFKTTNGAKHIRLRIDGVELDGFDSEAALMLNSNNSNNNQQQQHHASASERWLVLRKAPAGAHACLDQLLFQTFTASSLLLQNNFQNQSQTQSNNNQVSSIISASITTAARVAIQRANYLNNSNNSSSNWPLWCRNDFNNNSAALAVDNDVPYLPCAYTFSIIIRALSSNNNLSSSTTPTPSTNSLSISNITLLDEEGCALEQDFMCWEPTAAASSAQGPFRVVDDNNINNNNHNENVVAVHVSFETVRCMSMLVFDFISSSSSLQNQKNVEVSVLANDLQIFGMLMSVGGGGGGRQQQQKHIVPFCPDERLLSRFRREILAMRRGG